MPKKQSLEERFLEKFDQTEGCWNWKGSIKKSMRPGHGGYGQFAITPEEVFSAHRFSYLWFVGEIPEGLQVLHSCDNRKCVNPDHLFLGTHQDNMDDMKRKGRGYRAGEPLCV